MDRVSFETKMQVGGDGAISGIAWPFDGGPDHIGDLIERGAFKAALPIPVLFGHDPAEPLGVWESAAETAAGWEVKGRLLVDDVARAREVRALMKAGAVTGLSIGYRVRSSARRPDGGRTIKALDVYEVSLVTFPMHPGARVTSAKSAIAALRVAEAIHRAAARFATR